MPNISIRKRVSTIVIHEGHLLGFRAEDPHNGKRYVFLPGGQIKKDESIEDAATRETKEETGYIVKVDSKFKYLGSYDFEWNGALNSCQTWFLAAKLWPPTQTPVVVSNASYHQGGIWTPVDKIKFVFEYHKAILQGIELVIMEGLS